MLEMVFVVQHHVNTMTMIWLSLIISAVTSSIASASHRASRVISPVRKVSTDHIIIQDALN